MVKKIELDKTQHSLEFDTLTSVTMKITKFCNFELPL